MHQAEYIRQEKSYKYNKTVFSIISIARLALFSYN